MFKTLIVVLIAAAGINFMCNRSEPKAIEARPEISTQIEGEQFLLNAQDFDLQTVIAMIRDNKLKDAEDLEKKINDGSGINNVDVDNDGSIDYIKVKESRKGSAVALEFLAIPSSTKNLDDAVTVSTIDFSRKSGSNDVQIQGGYANHVNGHENSFFSSIVPSIGSSLGQALFLSWLFMPSRPYFYTPMMPMYAAYPVMPQNDLSRRRDSYRQNQNTSNINRSTQPSSFDAGSQKPKRSFSSLRNKGGVKSFEPRSGQIKSPRSTSSFKRPFRMPMRSFRRR